MQYYQKKQLFVQKNFTRNYINLDKEKILNMLNNVKLI